MAKLFTTDSVGTNNIKYIGTTKTIADNRCLTEDLFKFGNEESYKWYIKFDFNRIRFGLPVSFLEVENDLDSAILAYNTGVYGSGGMELTTLLNTNNPNFKFNASDDRYNEYRSCRLLPSNTNLESRFNRNNTVTSTIWNSSITYYLTDVFELDDPEIITISALIEGTNPHHMGFMIYGCQFTNSEQNWYDININNNSDHVAHWNVPSIYNFYCYDIRTSGLGINGGSRGICDEFNSDAGHLSDAVVRSDQYVVDNNIGTRTTFISGDILTIQLL